MAAPSGRFYLKTAGENDSLGQLLALLNRSRPGQQAMIPFAAGRGETIKRFLVKERIGKDARFWRLAWSLSALHASGIDEKRWGNGVLARKEGLGL